jgi:hypothetical protein
VPSEFGVRGLTVYVNCGIASVDFPIGKSPTRAESVDSLTHRGLGIFFARELCQRVSRYSETRFPDKKGEIAEEIVWVLRTPERSGRVL